MTFDSLIPEQGALYDLWPSESVGLEELWTLRGCKKVDSVSCDYTQVVWSAYWLHREDQGMLSSSSSEPGITGAFWILMMPNWIQVMKLHFLTSKASDEQIIKRLHVCLSSKHPNAHRIVSQCGHVICFHNPTMLRKMLHIIINVFSSSLILFSLYNMVTNITDERNA